MLRNYITISIRNIKRQLGYSLINILGLGLGLATSLLLVTWIMHELSYDEFHAKADRIYRVSIEYSFGGQVGKPSVSPTALLPALLNLPETETGVRVYNPAARSPYTVQNESNLFQETRFYFADSTFFKVFSFKLLRGNPDKVLTKPYSVILTKAYAQKYFGNDDPMGKTLRVNNDKDYIVTGIIEDIPSNSLLQFNLLASFNSLPEGRNEAQWWSANYQTFVVPHIHANTSLLNEKINMIGSKAVASDLTGKGDYVKYNFILLKDIHLKSEYSGEPEVVSDIKYIYIFSAIAVLILIIACINYVNLATARATGRAKEVGVRKVVGALRKQLLIQYLGESFMITFLAFCMAFLLAHLSLPILNEISGNKFSSAIFTDPLFIAFLSLALIVVSSLAGIYPAFVITAFKPATVLKGNFKTTQKGVWLRQTLVVLQFTISIILIVGTLVISKQLSFIQNKRLGYDRHNTIILPLDNKTNEKFETLKTELIRSGVATDVARGSETPIQVQGAYPINIEGASNLGMLITGLVVDEGYIPTLEIEIAAGRNFTKLDVEQPNQTGEYTFIINESAMAGLGIFPEKVIGTKVMMGRRKGSIIGVIKDFHFSSLHKHIGPLVMFPEARNFNNILVKARQGDMAENLETMKQVYTSIIAHRPFEFEFLDQQYEALYHAENRMGKVFVVFSVLAIIIACLGLLGLISFSVVQKTKEIGVRKVLGASSSSIVVLLTGSYTKLIFVATLVGFPIAYWLMNTWLQAFAYKIDIGIWPILIAALLCVLVAFGTATFHAIKATLINPADTLRNE